MKLLFFILFVNVLVSQNTRIDYLSSNYYRRIFRADSLFLEKNYTKSYKLLKNTFSECKPLQTNGYNEFETYTKLCFLLGKEKKFVENVKVLIEVFGYSKTQLSSDKILSKVFSIDKNIDVDWYYKTFLKSSSPVIKKEILELKRLDQLYRTSYAIYQDNFKKQDSIDSRNFKSVVSMFEFFGYPSYRKIGLNSSYAPSGYKITTVLLHVKDSLKTQYILPMLFKFVKKGTCDPIDYATVYDKYLIDNKREQLFYTYKVERELTKQEILEVDKRRIKIGLPRLKMGIWRLSKKYGENSPIVKRLKSMFN